MTVLGDGAEERRWVERVGEGAAGGGAVEHRFGEPGPWTLSASAAGCRAPHWMDQSLTLSTATITSSPPRPKKLSDAGLAEQHVGAAVADQDVVVEGALDVLVGRAEADLVAACDRVDPGGVDGEGDVEGAGVGLGLGEGGVVAAGAADDRAAGAAAARRQQVAAAFAVEEGRAGQAADQPVGAVAAVEACRRRGRTRAGRPRGRL